MRVPASKLLHFASFRCNMNTYPATLQLEIGAAQILSVTAVIEIAQKSALLCVNRSPSVRYDFRAGAKAIRYSVNIA